jgi:hypothetical protein
LAGEAVREALNHVWSVLQASGHPCGLMGGVALTVWNHPRATRDVDFLIDVDATQINPVVDQLRASGCRPKRSPPLVTVGSHHFMQFLYTPPEEFYDVQVDLLLAESEFQKSAMARRVARELHGVHGTVDVLNCDDLILFKLLAGRMIDRADAAMLLRENREEIDVDYLRAWVARLGLEHELEQIWDEAFGSEPPMG